LFISCSSPHAIIDIREYRYLTNDLFRGKLDLSQGSWLLMPLSVYQYGTFERQTDIILRETLRQHLQERLYFANQIKDRNGKQKIFDVGFDNIEPHLEYLKTETNFDYVMSVKIAYLDRDNGSEILVSDSELLNKRYYSPCKIYLRVYSLESKEVFFDGAYLSYVDDKKEGRKSIVFFDARSASKPTMTRFLKRIIP